VSGGANAATMAKVVDYSTYGVEGGAVQPVNVTLTSSDSGFAFSNGGLVNHFNQVSQVIAAVSRYLIATASARYCLYRRRPRPD